MVQKKWGGDTTRTANEKKYSITYDSMLDNKTKESQPAGWEAAAAAHGMVGHWSASGEQV